MTATTKRLSPDRLEEIKQYVSHGEWEDDGSLIGHIAALEAELAQESKRTEWARAELVRERSKRMVEAANLDQQFAASKARE
ncbi:MAG TPA: hypothetical protein VIJ14_09660, partial [Rhabdochlamydiaceae bacterium]